MNIKDLTESDIGRWVEYNLGYKKERGRIKSFNHEWVFVVYCCDDKWHLFKDYIAVATKPEDLKFVEVRMISFIDHESS